MNRTLTYCLMLLCLITLGSAALATTTLTLPDTGWRLWPDRQAQWHQDKVFLPEDVHLSQLPVHPPTGGWGMLNAHQGISVTLPSTVEQHYWGKFGFRPYTGGEYIDADSDPQVQNGNDIGVSWWWRPMSIPAGFTGKTVILHIRGARQRAEVYLNGMLVGYSMIEETGFDCDLTKAMKPGQVNTLAIRITNPGGRLDWGDWMTDTWGGVQYYLDHGFGGLDRDITLTAHGGPALISDAWALNTPQVHTIRACANLHNGTGKALVGVVRASVIAPGTGNVLAVKALPVRVPAGSDLPVQIPLSCSQAKLWDLKTPTLYCLHMAWTHGQSADTRDVTFGFRWFGPDGVGKNAVLRLNGKRIRMYSAISWGFWGLNGLWPTPALAVKEVTDAKTLGLNCLNFHRNMSKPEVLDDQDRLGLLRYEEPGGGQFAIGKHLPTDSGIATTSLEKYQEERILHMIDDDRSHPSLVVYVVQNEANFDIKNPRVFYLLRRMHLEDPSRTIVLKSGINPDGEAWMKPYDGTIYYDHGDGYSGWWDQHSVGTPDGTWQDGDYQGPTNHVYQNTDTREITDFGEMGGAAVPDNSALMVQQIKHLGGTSYDLRDHEQLLAAYNQFLDQWGFRQAFPTASQLFQSIGNKEYDYWANVIECARLSDASDYLTMSGWESTAIEDHSGLVDNLRNFHGDPKRIHDSLRRLLPVVRMRQSAVAPGGTVTYDLWLLNETHHPAPGALLLTLTDPQGKTRTLETYEAPVYHTDQFVYPLKAGLITPSLTQVGLYHLRFTQGSVQETRTIRVIGLPKFPHPIQVGVLGANAALLHDLNALPGVTATVYSPETRPDMVIATGQVGGSVSSVSDDTPIKNTSDPALYRNQRFGNSDTLGFTFAGLPPGPAQVTLYFAETYWTKPGQRVFDVRINGQTMLHNLDIFSQAGGIDTALTQTFTINAPDGTVTVQPGTTAVDNATFAAIKVQAGGKTQAVYFGKSPYTDQSGEVWQPYQAPDTLDAGLLERVKNGLPLLVMTQDGAVADGFARDLAHAGAFTYNGLVGGQRAPWMGDWYFVRADPLYAALPVNEAMQGDYQVGPSSANGLQVSGPGVRIVTGYGRDHDRTLGAGDFTAMLGRGKILFHCMPPMNPVFQQRWLANALLLLSH
jgi:beta-galactosidase